jgi:hypothetical protein
MRLAKEAIAIAFLIQAADPQHSQSPSIFLDYESDSDSENGPMKT